MERITLYIRTTKTAGKIKLRFRLTEGREIQLFHKSQIEAELSDLKKFNPDGTLKSRVSIYNIADSIFALHRNYENIRNIE